MSFDKVLNFLDEGMVGFAALAICLAIVLPLLPLIALGYGFSRVLRAVEAWRAA